MIAPTEHTASAAPLDSTAPEKVLPDGADRAPAGADAPVPVAPAARWRPPVAVAVVLLGLLAGQAAAFAILAAAGGRDASDEAAAIGLVVADLIILGIIVAFARRGAERLTPATLGVRRTRFWPAVGWMLAIWVGVSALTAIIALLAGGGTNVEARETAPSTLAMLLMLLGVAVTAPIVEELAFRGYLFPAVTRWRGPWIAAILTAALFGAAHIASTPPELLPAIAVFGFGACVLFWFTGSLLPCVALHALNNAIVISTVGDWTWQVPVAIVGCVLLSVGLLLPFARERARQAAV